MSSIACRLVEKGTQLREQKASFVHFTGEDDAGQLLNDLDAHPHAFVIACIMDRQVKVKVADLVPFRISQRVGDFAFGALRQLSLEQIRHHMTKPEPLHRFPEIMAKSLYLAIAHIATEYGGNASRIWADKPSSAEVVYRFLCFHGVGPKIATMAANILAREFKIPMSDYYSIDISADVHVRRVFQRLGLVRQGAGNDEIIYRARTLHPEFPGLMDFPCWEIGRQWCKPRTPSAANAIWLTFVQRLLRGSPECAVKLSHTSMRRMVSERVAQGDLVRAEGTRTRDASSWIEGSRTRTEGIPRASCLVSSSAPPCLRGET